MKEVAVLNIPVTDDLELKTENGSVVVSSRVVADRFGKQHKHALESIENIIAENSALIGSYFIPSTYQAGTGKSYKEYLLTRDGFTLLAMGFTGKEALQWKLKYIEAFNKMEEALKRPRPLTTKEELKLHYQWMGEQAEEIKEIKEEVTELKDNMPLFTCECRELQARVKKVGILSLGGYKSKAYNDNSLRGKIYSDIQKQLKREFGVSMYQAIKRNQFDKAKEIVEGYKAPHVLSVEIDLVNQQIGFYE